MLFRKKHHPIRNFIILVIIIGIILYIGGINPSNVAAKAGEAPETVSGLIEDGTVSAFIGAFVSGIRDFVNSILSFGK